VVADIFFFCFMWMIYHLQQMIMSSLFETKRVLSSHFDMKDLVEASYVSGVQILRDRNNGALELSQKTIID
jgi:hypothetical protein